MSNNKQLDNALGEALSHLRDTSVRDGIQSWDANKWKIADIIPVISEIDKLATTLADETKSDEKPEGVKLPPVEAWGGGQFAQPALFNQEDPIHNLKRLHEAAPNLDLQCLYRGRQGFGFVPIKDEIQESAIQIAGDNGIKVFRIFDMMNDLQNLETGVNAIKKYKETHPDVTLEGGVSYISEPHGNEPHATKGRAWEINDYAIMARNLADMGCDEIAIKNFSGTGDYEMPELVAAMRKMLNESGHENVKLNLHSHGHKPDVLAECIAAGADKVDVGIGELSEGPAHTNMRKMVHHLLEGKGFTAEEIDAHPIMHQISVIEEKISAVVHRKSIKLKDKEELVSFDDLRAPLKKLVQNKDLLERSRMAAGALSDLTSRFQSGYEGKVREWTAKGMQNIPTVDDLVNKALAIGSELWERAGRFNTVTPGAKILTDQIVPLTIAAVEGKPRTMGMYNDRLIDVAVGRFGQNRGMEKSIGDKSWRDALLMFRALKAINKELEANRMSPYDLNKIFHDAGFIGDTRISVRTGSAGSRINLEDPNIEKVLTSKHIAHFETAIDTSGLKPETIQNIKAAMSTSRSVPTRTLADGQKIVDDTGADFDAMAAEGKPASAKEYQATLAVLLQDPSKMDLNGTYKAVVKSVSENISIPADGMAARVGSAPAIEAGKRAVGGS